MRENYITQPQRSQSNLLSQKDNFAASPPWPQFLKKQLLFMTALLFLLVTLPAMAQVTIGTGTSTQIYPLGSYFGYERSASIYTPAEITTTGSITTLAWYANTASTIARPVVIYLKATTASTLTASTWASQIAGATTVYSGNLSPVAGWNTITLTTPFNYFGGSNNLEVLVEANYGGGGGTGSGGSAVRYSSVTSAHMYYIQDNTAPAGNGTVNGQRPNLQLTVTPVTTPYLGTGSLAAFGNVCPGATSAANLFTVTGLNLTNDVTIGALGGYTYSTTSGGTYTSTLALSPVSGSISQTVYVKFTPAAVQSYNGNIAITGADLTSAVNVAASGAGVNSAPALSSNGTSAITATSATITGAAISALGCTAVSDYGIQYSTSSTFATGNLTVTGTGFSGAAGGTFNAALSGLTANTTYYYRAYATNGGGTTYFATTSSLYTGYCTPASTAPSTARYINNFTTTGGTTNVANASTYSAGGYGNFTAQSFSQFATGAVGFTATMTGGTFGVSIWIDLNNDLDFDDAGEKLYGSTAYANAVTSSFVIPAGTPVGSYRVRVVADWSTAAPNTPCSLVSGEGEDYTLNVIATPPACSIPNAAASISFGTVASTSIAGTITAAATAPTGYLVVRSLASALTVAPVTNTAYTAGASFGGGTVVSYGTSLTFSNTGLNPNTAYYYFVYTYNNGGATCLGPVYSAASTNAGTATCTADPLIVGASNVTNANANLNWSSAAGGAARTVTYTIEVASDAAFATITASASGLTSLQYNVTGLTANATYYYRVKAISSGCSTGNWVSSNFVATNTYTPIDVSGYNYDVIADGVGTAASSTNNSVDSNAVGVGSNFAYMANSYRLNATDAAITYALPLNRVLNSPTTGLSGLKFFLGDYAANNSLKLATGEFGLLNLVTPVKLTDIYLAVTGGSGGPTVDALITFDDATTQTTAGIVFTDWYNAGTTAVPALISNIGRVSRETGVAGTGAAKIFQVAIPIITANQTKKVVSVKLTNTGTTTGFANMFAISGKIIGDCPTMGGVTAHSNAGTSGTADWTLGNPGGALTSAVSYTVEVYTNATYTTPIAGSPFTGITANTYTFSGLALNTTYYIRVKATNGICESGYATGSFYNGYCIPTNVSSTTNYISGVTTTGGITNFSNTGTGFSAYTDYSAGNSVSMYPIGTFSITATHPSSTYGYTVWIDWNNDLDFDDAGETVFTTGASYLATPATVGPITIPAGTAVGNYRLRIRNAFVSSPAPACGEFGYGEAEDYTVTVVPAPPACATPDAPASLTLVSGSTTITGTITAAATAPTGYLLIRSTSATLSAGPATNTVYSNGNTIGGGTVIGYSASLTFNETGLNTNTPYYYFVYAYNNGGTTCLGPVYSTATTATATTCFGAPVIVGASNVKNASANLNWVAVAGATYTVDVATDAAFTSLFASYSAITGTRQSLTGLAANATYYYRVKVSAPGACDSGYTTSSFVAQNSYTPIDVTGGYTTDVIANGTGIANLSTTGAVDGASNAYLSIDYRQTATSAASTIGLPVNRNLTSPISGLKFFIPDYNANNSLRIGDQNGFGTLAFETPVKLTDVYIAVTGGSGAPTVTAEILFNDNTSQVTPNIGIIDWYAAGTTAQPALISGIGRVNRADAVGGIETGASKVFQITIPVEAANQTKLVTGVKFTKTSTGATEPVVNIFAISGKIIGDCPSMGAVTGVASSTTSGAVNWTLSSAGDGGGLVTYTVEVYSDAAYTTAISGSPFTTTATTQALTGLTFGSTYYFKVKANNTVCDSGYATGSLTLNYCTPSTGTINGTDIITNVVVSSAGVVYSNPSASAAPNYTSYNNTPIAIARGVSSTIAITFGTDSTQWGAAWIDYNHNLVFDSGEEVIALGTSATAGSSTQTYTFTVPATAMLGTTKLRVRGGSDSAYSATGACDATSYGETEDYNVTITLPPTCTVPATVTATVTSATTANFSWAAPTVGTTPVGYEYVVSTSDTPPTGSGTATTATTVTGYTITPFTTYYLYVRTSCGGGDYSLWTSTPFTASYCAPTSGTINTVDIVTNVSLTNSLGANYANASESNETNNYSIYNNTPLALVQGSTTNTVAITFGTDGTQYSAAWIDFNQNLSFDTGEAIGVATSSVGNGATVTYTFAIPANAVLGTTKLRVRGGSDNQYAANGACATTGYGETEDYYVTITGACYDWTGAVSAAWATPGNWCGGTVPTATSNVTIAVTANQPVISTGTAFANNLTVAPGASLTVNTGATLSVAATLTTTGGTLTVQNNAALLQGSAVTANTNVGSITAVKNSNSLYRLDYTMWSSPVSGQTLGGFSSLTSTGRFYEYGVAAGAEHYIVVPETTVFEAAKGYLIRMPNTDPATGYSAGTTAVAFVGNFTGTPNNGTVTRAASVIADRYTAVGNPYPSPISVTDFFSQNSNVIDGGSALYFWRKKNNSAISSYASLNLTGFTSNEASTGNTGGQNNASFFSGVNTGWLIAQGQGFLVRTKTNPTATNITFTNSMRRAAPTSGTQSFFRTGADTMSRFWINLTDSENGFSQAMVAYSDATTLGLDYGYDGELHADGGRVSLYSLAADKNLSIQARPAFAPVDVVPMGFTANNAGQFTIALDRMDGLFEQGQVIYLKDNLLGITRSLATSSYSFASEAGTFNDRFEIVYATSALGTDTPTLDTNTVMVYKEGYSIKINSGTAEMTGVKIFDIRGRQLYSKDGINAKQTAVNGLQVAQEVLIVEITTVKGKVSKRIVF